MLGVLTQSITFWQPAERMPASSHEDPFYDPVYVAARKVLLDALSALEPYRDAVILAGAQAVYLHTGVGQLAIAPYTSDADLAIDPLTLPQRPELEEAMSAAGFSLQLNRDGHVEPGVWLASVSIDGRDMNIPVDLIVPEGAIPQPGRRAARLVGHGRRVARRSIGLEAALVDNHPMTIAAFDPNDGRSITAKVAGVAALLIAKAHKLSDRVSGPRPSRLEDKDAADVVRIMQTTDPCRVADTFVQLKCDSIAGETSSAALLQLERLFGRRGRPGIEMAARALRTGVSKEYVEALATAYIAELIRH